MKLADRLGHTASSWSSSISVRSTSRPHQLLGNRPRCLGLHCLNGFVAQVVTGSGSISNYAINGQITFRNTMLGHGTKQLKQRKRHSCWPRRVAAASRNGPEPSRKLGVSSVSNLTM
jgi:hypothetical protein